MKQRRRLFQTTAVLATSLAAFGPGAAAKEMKEAKKARSVTSAPRSPAPSAGGGPAPRKIPAPAKQAAKRPLPLESALTAPLGTDTPTIQFRTPAPTGGNPLAIHGLRAGRYPWRMNIVTTTFWVGESAAKNNPVANFASSWDPEWSRSYGGLDTPDRTQRANYLPVAFTPQQNPFYIALPYNDVTRGTHKPEASLVVPWFREALRQPGRTVLKGRWIAIHFNGRVAYAQWEDCGPFRTDHHEYVFGQERPKPNLNKGAGLDVSPAVRDYLGMNNTDVTDWRFVEFEEVPRGPWSTHGNNNPFVLQDREKSAPVVLLGSGEKADAAPAKPGSP